MTIELTLSSASSSVLSSCPSALSSSSNSLSEKAHQASQACVDASRHEDPCWPFRGVHDHPLVPHLRDRPGAFGRSVKLGFDWHLGHGGLLVQSLTFFDFIVSPEISLDCCPSSCGRWDRHAFSLNPTQASTPSPTPTSKFLPQGAKLHG